MRVGIRIHQLMTEKEVPPAKMAEELGISRQAVSQWRNHGPGMQLFFEACRVLGVSADDVLRHCRENPDPVEAEPDTAA